MRKGMLYAFLLLSAPAAAQQDKTYTVNSIRDNREEVIRDAYRYPQFRPGAVVFNDGSVTPARLNYHRLSDQVLFIAPKGDTLALAEPATFKYVVIGTDTFYMQDKGYLERLTHYVGVNLARKGTIVLAGRERKGAYGTYSSTIATDAKAYYSADGSRITHLQVDVNDIYRAKTRYFLSDRYNNFFPATKKNFYNLFFRQEARLRDYLEANKVNFYREEDLLQLMTFLQEEAQ